MCFVWRPIMSPDTDTDADADAEQDASFTHTRMHPHREHAFSSLSARHLPRQPVRLQPRPAAVREAPELRRRVRRPLGTGLPHLHLRQTASVLGAVDAHRARQWRQLGGCLWLIPIIGEILGGASLNCLICSACCHIYNWTSCVGHCIGCSSS